MMFPDIIKGLRGTDTSIEFITTLTLQNIRISVRNYRAERRTGYIFVQTEYRYAIRDQKESDEE